MHPFTYSCKINFSSSTQLEQLAIRQQNLGTVSLPRSPMQQIIRSKVRGVAVGDSCGLFIHGRPVRQRPTWSDPH